HSRGAAPRPRRPHDPLGAPRAPRAAPFSPLADAERVCSRDDEPLDAADGGTVTKYGIRRVIQAIPVLFGITIVVYMILLAAPGGPTARFANNPRVTLEDREHFKKAWGLDQPIPVQYCRWIGACNPDVSGTVLGIFPPPAALLGPTGWAHRLSSESSGATNGVLHGDFGVSVDSGEPVATRIARAALPTLIL